MLICCVNLILFCESHHTLSISFPLALFFTLFLCFYHLQAFCLHFGFFLLHFVYLLLLVFFSLFCAYHCNISINIVCTFALLSIFYLLFDFCHRLLQSLRLYSRQI